MARRLLTDVNGTKTYFHGAVDGKGAIETEFNYSPHLERAKALHNAGHFRTGMGDRHAASIPITVLQAWALKRGKTFMDVMQDQGLMGQFLADPDNDYWLIDKKAAK